MNQHLHSVSIIIVEEIARQFRSQACMHDNLKNLTSLATGPSGRQAAKDKFNLRSIKAPLDARGIHVLSAGADEVLGAYRHIESIMAAHSDLNEPIARFDPKLVKTYGEGSRAKV